jgi:hypothetical protein
MTRIVSEEWTFSTSTSDFNISNDVGRVKGHGLLFLSFADTRFASAQTHWFLSRE